MAGNPPRLNWLGAAKSGSLLRKSINVSIPTIATAAGNTDIFVLVPETGYLDSVDFSATDALAASDTNYLSITISVFTPGATALTLAGDTNTTKATGGSGISAHTKRSLALINPQPVKLNAGDRLRVRVAVTGTLANTVTNGAMVIRVALTE